MFDLIYWGWVSIFPIVEVKTVVFSPGLTRLGACLDSTLPMCVTEYMPMGDMEFLGCANNVRQMPYVCDLKGN